MHFVKVTMLTQCKSVWGEGGGGGAGEGTMPTLSALPLTEEGLSRISAPEFKFLRE